MMMNLIELIKRELKFKFYFLTIKEIWDNQIHQYILRPFHMPIKIMSNNYHNKMTNLNHV